MKISQNTLSILRNFSGINDKFVLKPGNVIKIINAATFGVAEIPEVFPLEFCVDNLPKFLTAINLFETPELEFFDNYVKISEGKSYVRYVFTEPNLISDADKPPINDIKFPDPDYDFELSEEDFSLILKAVSVLGSPYINIVGEDGVLYVQVSDKDDPTSNKLSMAVGVADKEFFDTFNASNFKFLTRKYIVSIKVDKIVRFKSDDVTYYIARHKG